MFGNNGSKSWNNMSYSIIRGNSDPIVYMMKPSFYFDENVRNLSFLISDISRLL